MATPKRRRRTPDQAAPAHDAHTAALEAEVERLRAELSEARAGPDRIAPSEQQAALEVREHSISLLRATIESTADGILVVDTAGKVRLLNQRFLDMWGIPHKIAAAGDDERMVTFVLNQLRDPGSFQARIRELYERPQDESNDVLEFLDGRTFERYSRPQRLDHEVIGRVWSFRDVTEQRHSAQELNEHAANQSFLARASSELTAALGFEKTVRKVAHLAVPRLADWCVVGFTIDGGRLRRVASAHRDAHKKPLLDRLPDSCPADAAAGMPPEGEPPKEVRVVRVPEDAALEVVAPLAECAALLRELGIRALMHVPLVARDQLLGDLVAVRTGAGCDWSDRERAVALEFGYRAALAADNARLYETAIEANRAKSDFLAVMSHELRTPLNAIVGYANLMQAGVPAPLPPPQREHLDRILVSTRHLTELIENVLTLSRVEAGREETRSERTDLKELTREVAELIEPAFTEKGLELRLELPDEPVIVRTDPGKVRQILLNLLSNAAKFTEQGYAQTELHAEPSRVRAVVSDTGAGIEHADLDRIFEAFTQVQRGAKRVQGGTGLGLSVSRHLARLLGGDLVAESEPRVGSRFELALPRKPTDREEETRV